MPKRDLAWRLASFVPLALSAGTSLAHRSVLNAAQHGAASVAEFVLCLLSFVLASLGVLLLINGARLRDDWRRDLSRLSPGAGAARERSPAGDRHEAASIECYLRTHAPGRVATGAMPGQPD